MLYSDLWHLRHPGQPAMLMNWDNGEWDARDPPAEASINTFESCEQYCRKDGACLQWNWRGGDEKRCILMRSIRYGAARSPEYMKDGKTRETIPERELDKKPGGNWVDYRSGWIEDRAQSWRERRKCEAAHWVGPSISRVF
jgi:hypothetical protein